MEDNCKILHSVWDKSPDRISSEKTEHEITEYNRLITSLFCPGPHYYYIVDFFDRQIKQISGNIESIMGISQQSVTFDDIINSMHPDDMEFVAKAEDAAYAYIYNVLGKENILKYKVSYCFRSKTINNEYQLFNHQAIVLTVDNNYGFGRSLNIHTNINHITSKNNYKIHLVGISDESDIIEIDINASKNKKENNFKNKPVSLFSKRESEIINLITFGFTNEKIAERLFISPHTVKNHRKNMLKKAAVRNSTELIAKCMHDGLL